SAEEGDREDEQEVAGDDHPVEAGERSHRGRSLQEPTTTPRSPRSEVAVSLKKQLSTSDVTRGRPAREIREVPAYERAPGSGADPANAAPLGAAPVAPHPHRAQDRPGRKPAGAGSCSPRVRRRACWRAASLGWSDEELRGAVPLGASGLR